MGQFFQPQSLHRAVSLEPFPLGLGGSELEKLATSLPHNQAKSGLAQSNGMGILGVYLPPPSRSSPKKRVQGVQNQYASKMAQHMST